MTASRKQTTTFKVKALHVALASAFTVLPVYANPTSPTVVNGTVSMSTVGNTLTVTNTPGSIIHWQQFSINAGETTRFIQQGATSSVLNRVTGGSASQIMGALQSNGRVFIINPAGIVFGSSAVVNVAGLVASSLNISDQDFLSGKMKFAADSASLGNVTNAGNITTPNGGFVYIVAPKVENTGVITTPSGEAVLAAGHSVELVDSADPNLRVVVNAPTSDVNLSQIMTSTNGDIYQVLNSGRISANTAVVGENGRVYLKSAGNIETTTTSVIEAKGDINMDGGHIQAYADKDGLYRGNFDASGRNGGFVETSGAFVDIDNARVKVAALSPSGRGGHWLIDPTDIIISSGYSISTVLGSGSDVTLDTNAYGGTDAGNIIINAYIDSSYGGGTGTGSLILKANNNIEINDNISLEGRLDMTAGANVTIGAYTSIEAAQVFVNAGGDFRLVSDCPDGCSAASISATSNSSFNHALIDIRANNIYIGGGYNGGYIKSTSSDTNATILLKANNNIVISSYDGYSPNIEARSDFGAGGYAHVHMFAGNSISISDTSGVYANTSASNQYAEILMIAPSVTISNSYIEAQSDYGGAYVGIGGISSMSIYDSFVISDGYSGGYDVGSIGLKSKNLLIADNTYIIGKYVGINYPGPESIQVDSQGFFDFISDASVNVTGSFVSGEYGLGFAGQNVTITDSTLSGDMMHGIATGKLQLIDNAALYADSEMLLEAGSGIYLDNNSRILVESPSTLYFNFPYLVNDGWFLDGIAGVFTGPNGSLIMVDGAEPILGTNFFVTYGGGQIIQTIITQSLYNPDQTTQLALQEEEDDDDEEGTDNQDQPRECS